MKTLIAVLLILAFSGFCFAQNSPKSNTEEVSVISASYQKGTGNSILQPVYESVSVQGRRGNESSLADPPPPDSLIYKKQSVSVVPVATQNRALVQFRNNTQKIVTAIEYNFVIHNKNGKELKRYKLTNNSDIKPFGTKVISDVVGSHSKALVYKAEITRVVYKDRSVWVP